MSLVSLSSAKEYLRVTVDDAVQDALIQTLLNSAESVVEKHLGTSFFPLEKTEIYPGSTLYWRPSLLPLISVDTVYAPASDYTFFSDEYYISDNCIYPAVSGKMTGNRWPRGVYEVTYTAGYSYAGSINNVPDGIDAIILALTERMFKNRGDLSSENSGVAGSLGWYHLNRDSDILFLLGKYDLHGI